MDKHFILGVHITNRVKNAAEVQKTFTQYGCSIRTRIGLHHVDEGVCSPNGLILLEVFDSDAVCQEMMNKLSKIEGIEVQRMVFDHPDG